MALLAPVLVGEVAGLRTRSSSNGNVSVLMASALMSDSSSDSTRFGGAFTRAAAGFGGGGALSAAVDITRGKQLIEAMYVCAGNK